MKLVDTSTKILIVGMGQVGGGYAQALSSLGFEVGAIDIDPYSIDYALEHGWISHGKTTADPEYIGQFGMVVMALYPKIFIEWIKNNQKYLKSGTLITDVTGVKSSIVGPVQDILRDDCEFIAAHPMAGRETIGITSANKGLFIGANFIVTPTENNTPEAIETCKMLGRLIGFEHISVLTPDEHDDMIAFLSQFTHCLAVILMMCNDSDKLVDYTGDSFRDLTRIAKINDKMWSELFLMNKDKLLAQFSLFEKNFEKFRTALEASDSETMREYMRLSTARRRKFDK